MLFLFFYLCDIILVGDGMKNKGFTLVELLGVIIILGLLTLIVYPIINNAFNDSTSKLSNNQKSALENVARIWGTKNTELLSEMEPYYLTIESLKKSGLLENKDILDPETEEQIKGCIKIEYQQNKYVYTYGEYKNVESCH